MNCIKRRTCGCCGEAYIIICHETHLLFSWSIGKVFYIKWVADIGNQIPKKEKSGNDDFVKDPYILEFLGIKPDEKMTESNLESLIIDHLEKFLLELGRGFSFVERQMHVKTETSDFYIDLVFYNYLLKCFVLVDLKLDKLKHEDIGQMDMYVRGSLQEGFVYIFKDQKLYVHKSYFEDSFLGDRSPSQFLVFKAESYDYYKNDRGQNECHFTNVREIEEYYCYRENTKHYFQDKYGFKRMEILKDQSFEYCDEKFNKLLP